MAFLPEAMAMAIPSITFTSIVFAFSFLIVTTCTITWLTTTISYHLAVRRFNQSSPSQASPPPTLPYALPWLGSALTFLNETPGSFFRSVQHILASSSSSSTAGSKNKLEALTILLGGNKSHVLASPIAVQGLFKARNLSRDRFNRDIVVKGMGLRREDDVKAYPWAYDATKEGAEMEDMTHEIFGRFLLGASAVNCLTSKFLEVLRGKDGLGAFEGGDDGGKEVLMYEYVKETMFTASTTALMGKKILEMNPDFGRQYWEFDSSLLTRFYGVPRWLKPRAYQVMEDLLTSVEKWVKYVREVYGKEGPPEEPEWEEVSGAKVVRARHRMYRDIGLSLRGCASFDIGFLFGLASNAIPATGWMLSHLLSPGNAHILAEIQTELESTKRADGTIDVPILISLPYLNSAFNETLRLYVDVLVTRELKSDLTLERYSMKKGDLVMAPSFLGHRDPVLWSQEEMPAESAWYGERFLKQEEKTGKATFTTSGTTGKFFPFGGGAQICPGRVFAKQEVLGAVAAFLLTFDVDFIEFVRANNKGIVIGKGTRLDAFPVVKKQYAGSGVVTMDGDLRVRLRRKDW